MYAMRPPRHLRNLNPLVINCVVNKQLAGMESVSKVTIARSKVGAGEEFSPVAEVQGEEVNTDSFGITAAGDTTGKLTVHLTMTYTAPTDGYCYQYNCIAEGTDKDRNPTTKFTTVTVDGIDDGKCCDLSEQLNNATQAIEMLEVNMEETSKKLAENSDVILDGGKKIHDLQARIKGLYKIVSIHPLFYVPSAVYKETKIYTLSRRTMNFDLEKMNNFCKEMGGYLAEIDDAEEFEFVASKIATITRYPVYIGTNDVEEEGKYVHYNSKKPLLDGLKWKAGNPDNVGDEPGEDCMIIKPDGLNDNACNQSSRFICEIPIV
ncbi:Cd209 antigen [Plakobranchus ocellatus]|uniref:Cd209 antigen n=1 Tax=Plakobranchus ocellatus TaxID=259542 RepID=A0AAV3YDQ1_9GAST|nr:Cd209 antigen [Plakobranchus ocellatus]